MKKTILLLLQLCLSHFLFAQALNFSRIYKGKKYEDARSITAAQNGTFVITGLDKNNEDSLGDMYAMKVNAAGAILWKYHYGFPKEDGGNFILTTRDGGYLIAGHSNNAPDDECDGYVVKINKDGLQEWGLFVGTALDEVCQGAVETADGNFYLTGRFEETNKPHQFDVLLCKINPNGKLLWLKSLPAPLSEEGVRITLSSDNQLFISGFAYNANKDKEQMLLMKSDMEGNLIWNRTWESSFHERAMFVVPTENGACMIGGGASNERYIKNCEQFIIKSIDNQGNVKKEFSNITNLFKRSYAFDAVKLNDGNFAISGIQSENETPFLMTINSELNYKSHKEMGSINASRPLALLPIINGDVFICGKESQSSKSVNIWLSRVSISVNNLSSNSVLNEIGLIRAFPNPCFDDFYIYSTDTSDKSIEIVTLAGIRILKYDYVGNDIIIKNDALPQHQLYVYIIKDAKGKVLKKELFMKM